jgi:arylsulfatase A-like enzyme
VRAQLTCAITISWALAAFATIRCERSCESPAGTGERQNVVLIVLDTARVDHFSAYGYERPTTPHFDAFARDAILFKRAYATSSWTVPSHASLFTGLLPATHRADQRSQLLDERFETLAELLGAAGYEAACYSNNPWVSQRNGLVQGFQLVEPLWQRSRASSHGTNREIIRWLDQRSCERPFFLFVNYIEPHWPYAAPEGFQDRFLPKDLPPYRRAQGGFRVMDWYLDRDAFQPELLTIRRSLYDAELAAADDIMGDLLASLRERGLYDESLIVVTSDHGENLGDHGHQGHSFALYESTIRVPLAIRPPGHAQSGVVERAPIQLTDVFTTIASHAGVEIRDPRVVGRDLLAGELAEDWPIYADYAYPVQALKRFPDTPKAREKLQPFMRHIRSIQVEGDKLVWGSDGRHELYNLRRDPGEHENRITQTPELAERLRVHLEDRVQELSDASTDAQPPDPDALRALRSLGYIR